ncbi:MAG: orotate phosphoribosyltransferase [Deltaproteobacteria bacterium]|nr:orotate phosphoribosyltransferase [Deltaproteobacteria bacterium]
MSGASRQSLLDLLRKRSLRRGDFVLASGKRSSVYIDCRQTTLSARGHALVGELLLDQIRGAESAGQGPFAALGGVELGAVPIASAVACASNSQPPRLDTFVVRRQTKDHGTAAPIEGIGALPNGSNVVLVEDVVTSGNSLLRALDVVQAAGFRAGLALALVDRGEGGVAALAQRGVRCQALFTLREIVEVK